MKPRRVQNMSYKQRITPNPPLSTPPMKHPPTYIKENLVAVDGSSQTNNAKDLIVFKGDVMT